MPINWDKYKTYDTSKGYGNPQDWLKQFETVSGQTWQDFVRDYKEEPVNQTGSTTKEKPQKVTSLKELNKWFRSEIMKVHPDIAGESKENTIKTQQLIEKYEKLKKKYKS